MLLFGISWMPFALADGVLLLGLVALLLVRRDGPTLQRGLLVAAGAAVVNVAGYALVIGLLASSGPVEGSTAAANRGDRWLAGFAALTVALLAGVIGALRYVSRRASHPADADA